MICWFAIDLRPLQPTNHYCLTINFNLFMDREWITTSELLAYLKAHPDDEKECRPLCIPATGLLHLSEKAR